MTAESIKGAINALMSQNLENYKKVSTNALKAF